MIRIEMSPNDKKDLIRILNFAYKRLEYHYTHKKIKNHFDQWDDSKYWMIRIEQIKAVINGRNISDSLVKSSLGTLEGDLLDVLDN